MGICLGKVPSAMRAYMVDLESPVVAFTAGSRISLLDKLLIVIIDFEGLL